MLTSFSDDSTQTQIEGIKDIKKIAKMLNKLVYGDTTDDSSGGLAVASDDTDLEGSNSESSSEEEDAPVGIGSAVLDGDFDYKDPLGPVIYSPPPPRAATKP
eukprot:UN03592